MLTTRERIITAQELARQVEVALSNAQQEPLIVTESGQPIAYLISVDLFDKLLAHLEAVDAAELKAAVAIGEEQFAQGNYKSIEEAEAILEAAWKELEST
jgi:prevent-host-death family protein